MPPPRGAEMNSSVAEPGTSIVVQSDANLTQRIGLIGGPILLILLWFAPFHENPAGQHAIAISGLMILLWATEAVDYALAGFIGVFLFWALGVSKLETAFSGFASETSWFLLGAMLISTMASKSGLARRLAYAITARIGRSYSRLLLIFIVADFLLTFLVPSGIARVTVLAVIACGAVQALGDAPRSNVARGLLLIVTYTAGVFDKMIIAGEASILARGIIEQTGNAPVPYNRWLLAYLPCDLITIFCCWRIALWLYPQENHSSKDGAQAHVEAELRGFGPWSREEKRCAALLAIAVGLWMTEFIHHVNPSIVGLSIGLLAPVIGVLETNHLRTINFGPIWFIAAALSMGKVLAETKGLEAVTRTMMNWMEFLNNGSGGSFAGAFGATLSLYWTGFVYHLFFANESLMLSTSLPAVLKSFTARGLHALPVGLIWTFASGGKIFAYESAVLVAGYSFGYFEAKDLFKIGLILAILESLILLILVALYWPLIGIV